MQKILRLILALPIIWFTLPAVANAESSADVRIIIDVSGSMKYNDPENLRAPGLRLLGGLMPGDAESGVWTFARYVNMLVPIQKVDDKWRQRVQQKSSEIHSLGLFTDIEQALQKATANVNAADSTKQRSIILLSDGLVDLDKGKAASEQSRQNIINTLLPQIKQKGFRIHTIALSEEADHELLKQLSMATDGWYHKVDNADELERVFLHLFEQATQRDSVPLVNNRFTIDNSVNEMTILVFRETETDITQLVQPDQKQQLADTNDPAIRWMQETHFDLITIEKPMAGEWFIDANIDPDNRVMVLTDLKLQTIDLPNNILAGEQFDIVAKLTDHGKQVERTDFLQLVTAELSTQPLQGEPINNTMALNNQTATFMANLGKLFDSGQNDIVITAKSDTFERQRRQSVNVVALPFDVTVTQLEADSRSHRLSMTADASMIDPESLQITALLSASDGSEFPYDVLRQSDNAWQLTLADLQPETAYQLSLQIRGKTLTGRNVFLQPKPIHLMDEVGATLTITSETPIGAEPADKPFEPVIIDPVVDEQTSVVDASSFRLSDTVILAIGNAVIVLLLLMGFWFWHRSRRRQLLPGDLL
ncbi:vWA domain-containing protein [Methylophaga muralis]|uniref:von Willebrand factor type A domain protein n=1 Tax=Methylophaga muralis TaxID=291169 RepID=A0A1E3GRW9_9GAMM|nr:vWA domain-containing protein [Methylophaga muralis]ODN66767.1 von Willebrand factor type A domain protein [Methylophaga muralis]